MDTAVRMVKCVVILPFGMHTLQNIPLKPCTHVMYND
jgi:hypothetical protein